MTQFFVVDPASMPRCEVSRAHRIADTFAGIGAIDHKPGNFTGIVQSIEQIRSFSGSDPSWRVTLISKPATRIVPRR